MKVFATKIFLSILGLCCISLAQIPDKPNIVVLFLDDAGYADFAFNGHQEFLTPRMDEIASKGIKFTQGYVSAAVCHPSRAGLITGRKQERFGHHYNGNFELQADQITIPEHLKQAGYKSMLVGKWHLGGTSGQPIDQGFDEFYGLIGGSGPYWDVSMTRNKEAQKEPIGSGVYLTDKYGDEAVAFIERNVNNPFFLFLSLTAVHGPNHAKPEQEAIFNNTSLSSARKTVAAMTWSADSVFGMVIDKLNELNLTSKTCVFLTNDNGGAAGRVNDPFSGMKGTILEGGIRVPYLMYWPGVLDQGTTFDFPVSTLDIFATASALAGLDMPSDRTMDGINLMPFVLGQRTERPHKYLYFDRHFSGLRYNDYKLILLEDTLGNKRQPVLYDISVDIKEENDLAFAKPGLTTAMIKELERWVADETITPLRFESDYWKNNSLQKYETRGTIGTFVQVDSGIVLEPETDPNFTPIQSLNAKPLNEILISKKNGRIHFKLNYDYFKIISLSIYSIQGKEIRNLGGTQTGTSSWEGRDSEGTMRLPGLYVLKVKQNNTLFKSKLFYL